MMRVPVKNGGFYGFFSIFTPCVDVCKSSLFVFCRVCVGLTWLCVCLSWFLKNVQNLNMGVLVCVEMRVNYFYIFFHEI